MHFRTFKQKIPDVLIILQFTLEVLTFILHSGIIHRNFMLTCLDLTLVLKEVFFHSNLLVLRNLRNLRKLTLV